VEFRRNPTIKRVHERHEHEFAGTLLVVGGLLVFAVALAGQFIGIVIGDPLVAGDPVATTGLVWLATGLVLGGVVVRFLARRPRNRPSLESWDAWATRRGLARVDGSSLHRAVPEWAERIVPLSTRLYAMQLGARQVTIGAVRRYSRNGQEEIGTYVLLARAGYLGVPAVSVSNLVGANELTVQGRELRLEHIELDERCAIRIARHADAVDVHALFDPRFVELLASSTATDWRARDGWVVFHADVADAMVAAPELLEDMCDFARQVLERLDAIPTGLGERNAA
jgi:hypothetical protein